MTAKIKTEGKREKSLESIEEEVFLNLLRTVNHLHAPPAQLLKEHGLTAQQYNVLRILSGAPKEGLTCNEVRDRMVTRLPDVTRLVDRLIDVGLVIRERCTKDRRVVRVTVSDEGRRLAQSLAPALIDVHRKMMGHVNESDLLKLNTLLNEIRNVKANDTKGE